MNSVENLNMFFDKINDKLTKMELQSTEHQESLIQNGVLIKQLIEHNNKLQNKFNIEENKKMVQSNIRRLNHRNFCIEYDLDLKTGLPKEE